MIWCCARCFKGYEIEDDTLLAFKDFLKNKGEGSIESLIVEDLPFCWEALGGAGTESIHSCADLEP